MKIHISNVDLTSRTGPNSFARRLVERLIEKNHEICESKDFYDVYLAFINAIDNPRDNSRLVQRLDGIWMKPEDYIEKNKFIKLTYERADHIIWQSEFDRDMSVFHWGQKPGTVINNGIDLRNVDVTNGDLIDLRHRFDRIFVCSANWRRHKRLKENIELFLEFQKKFSNLKCALLVLGSNPDYQVTSNNIFYTGSLPHEVCLQIYATANAMFHLAYLDHCPNTVVEAISQNCPVVCASTGGTHEIVRNNGIVIDELKKFNFELHDYTNPPMIDLTKDSIYEKIESISYRRKLERDYLDIGNVTDRYIDALIGN